MRLVRLGDYFGAVGYNEMNRYKEGLSCEREIT